MHFTKIMIAVAAMAAGTAFAAPAASQIAISSGASASKNNLKLALINRCSGQLGEYTNGTTNVSTYVCSTAGTFANADAPTAAEYATAGAGAVNFAGTVFSELRLNVTNGSFTAICLLAGWPVGTKCPTADQYKDPADAAVPATLKAAPANSVAIGGLLDLEPTGFTSDVRLNIPLTGITVASAQFGQAFGVAVSADLYNAMHADQLTTGAVAAGCTTADTARPECVPVIGKAQMAAIMSSNSTNAAYSRGANFLAPSLPNPTTLRYARRVDTSGTQAVAQQYFLGNVCNPTGTSTVVAEGASFAAGGTAVGTAMVVYGTGSTGNARDVLKIASPNYAIGVLSMENAQNESWKWVRVGGVNAFTNAQPNLSGANTASTLDGRYDFWFLSRFARPTAGTNGTNAGAFWSGVVTGLGTVAAGNTKGLFRTNETQFTKGTLSSCAVVTSN
jgi:hypothetical protein